MFTAWSCLGFSTCEMGRRCCIFSQDPPTGLCFVSIAALFWEHVERVSPTATASESPILEEEGGDFPPSLLPRPIHSSTRKSFLTSDPIFHAATQVFSQAGSSQTFQATQEQKRIS